MAAELAATRAVPTGRASRPFFWDPCHELSTRRADLYHKPVPCTSFMGSSYLHLSQAGTSRMVPPQASVQGGAAAFHRSCSSAVRAHHCAAVKIINETPAAAKHTDLNSCRHGQQATCGCPRHRALQGHVLGGGECTAAAGLAICSVQRGTAASITPPRIRRL